MQKVTYLLLLLQFAKAGSGLELRQNEGSGVFWTLVLGTYLFMSESNPYVHTQYRSIYHLLSG
jgi:hypothetical protein